MITYIYMSVKTPMPNYFLAIIDSSQMSNVEFSGEDKFDLPNSGTLIKLSDDDVDRNLLGGTYKDLIGKRVFWAKYAESDAFFLDDESGNNVVFISLDKLRGYDN
jgi:hypothetical protein